MKQILLFFAMMLYPKLANCVKTCLRKASCELKAEEGIGRSVAEVVEEEGFEIRTMQQILLFFAELLYPQLAQCWKTSLNTTPSELEADEVSGRTLENEVEVKESELDGMKKLLLFFAEMLYPQLVQCVNTCLAKTPCESKVEEGSGKSGDEEVEIRKSKMNEMKQLLLFLAEVLYPQLSQSGRPCSTQTPYELKEDEVVGRSLLDNVEVKEGEQDEMKQLLSLFAEILFPKILECAKTCATKTSFGCKDKEVIEQTALKKVKLEECEIRQIKKVLLFFAKMLYPSLCQSLKVWIFKTPSEFMPTNQSEKYNAEEVELHECEVRKLRKVLLFFAELLFPQLAYYLKEREIETPISLKLEIIRCKVPTQ
ncbi:unnamed protein product [Hydatigera taeniaeformis]|uniref:HEAT repeat-containing protein 1 n=1 Tax=Hydatigena taeniaeformis TaxID=6205 RepID=A0A0R3WRD3_HYDTA|nr:unnamed protein product [Hydatigera taeniaeformis]